MLTFTVIFPGKTYDPTCDVLLTKENKAGTPVVSQYSYTVNAIGQRTGVSNTGTALTAVRSITWGYDSLGQVAKADSSSIPGLDRFYTVARQVLWNPVRSIPEG